MKIAVIGTGKIGGTLGRALVDAGHSVIFGSRQPDADKLGVVATVTTVGDALTAPDVVLVAIPGDAVDDFVGEQAEALDGKLVVDVANKVGQPVINSAATYQKQAPGARYARCFNCVGMASLADPRFDGTTADMFFACAPADRGIVEELVSGRGAPPHVRGRGPRRRRRRVSSHHRPRLRPTAWRPPRVSHPPPRRAVDSASGARVKPEVCHGEAHLRLDRVSGRLHR